MITKIILISLFCCGWKVITSENMLLYPLAQWFKRLVKGYEPKNIDHYFTEHAKEVHPLIVENMQSEVNERINKWQKRGNWLLKPTFDCVMCYASFWGSIVYWLLTIFVYQHGVNIQTIVAWPIICMAVAAVNGLIYGLICKYEEYMR